MKGRASLLLFCRAIGCCLACSPLWLALSLPAQTEVWTTKDQRIRDVQALDSLLMPRLGEVTQDEQGLSSRTALLEGMVTEDSLNLLDWALLVHGWLRMGNDPHLRVRFDQLALASGHAGQLGLEVMDWESQWRRFGPSPSLPASAREAWLSRSCPWVSSWLSVPDSMSAFLPVEDANPSPKSTPDQRMAIQDHGAFVRWVIPSFGHGSNRQFARDFRRCRRKIRRLDAPVMLDLRGNMGGYRTRRHAALAVFLDENKWPIEQESTWRLQEDIGRIRPMPLVRTSRTCVQPLAVMLDGLSFSASLLLADALLLGERAQVFGQAPLGGRGGCSGSPKDHALSGTGLQVAIPTLETRLGSAPPSPFDLPGSSGQAGTAAMDEQWALAVRHLLTSDLLLTR